MALPEQVSLIGCSRFDITGKRPELRLIGKETRPGGTIEYRVECEPSMLGVKKKRIAVTDAELSPPYHKIRCKSICPYNGSGLSPETPLKICYND